MNKTLHYFWFGGNEKPESVMKCIKSWEKYLPDFEIKEWNESNFDVHMNTYISQAYEAKKYAFVSDFARFYILEKYGGLYFDTDVEIIKPIDKLLENDAFAGKENPDFVSPGLVLWVKEPHNPIMREAIEYYETHNFLNENGERIKINVCGIFTGIMKKHGFTPSDVVQVCGGFTIFPPEYFNPFDDATGKLNKTENTYTIHWYSKTWMSKRKILRNKCTRVIHRIFGVDIKQKLLGKK